MKYYANQCPNGVYTCVSQTERVVSIRAAQIACTSWDELERIGNKVVPVAVVPLAVVVEVNNDIRQVCKFIVDGFGPDTTVYHLNKIIDKLKEATS